ncbi:MAG: hypothetical protein JWP91_3580 [Fibrobacteres bacterium]|nr:hypothetical protein [Fibrobacterota bacterium]
MMERANLGNHDAKNLLARIGTALASAATVLALGYSPAGAEAKIELRPLQVGANLYFGQIFNVDTAIADVGNFNPTVTVPMTSLWMIQQADVGERLDFTMGLVGSLFYPFPEDNIAGYKSYRTGGFGILQANGTYKFGDVAEPWLKITVGQQGYKYNPYAKNFGEYLFRSEAYPTIIRSGDWGAIDNAAAGIWGAAFKTRSKGGMITNDLFVTMSDTRVPLYDLSFTDVVNFKLGKVLQVGGGVMLNRYVQFDPEKSSPRKIETGWINWTAADEARLRAYVDKFIGERPNALTRNDTAEYSRFRDPNGNIDTSLAPGTYWANSKRNLIVLLAQPDAVPYAAAEKKALLDNLDINFIDSKTIYAMGRFSIDPKPLIGLEEALGPQDLVLYGEAAVIGFNNFPIYYKSVSERMPMMLGFNLPTFKYLDFLTVEAEYLHNPHINSDYIPSLFRNPQPKSLDHTQPETPGIADSAFDGEKGIDWTKDDFKWSVTALKSFGVWNLSGQVGRDHFRPLDPYFRPSLTEAATTDKTWYYTVRLMVNL